ncbi:MAG: molybdopterin-guanine dinucleotide biosynthesis protein B [Deltaproteobacteria bacterium]|nr:molybdopterin-guanine dinucleotide biosynthesis protein B [Deltaproteobacteria bacterium]
MKVFGITGYKKSGKTTLGVKISQKLSKQGIKVGILKHVSGDMNFPDTDTARYKSCASLVCAISSKETELLIQKEKSIEDMLAFFDSDIVLVEGFKKEKTFPRIVCLRDKSEESDLLNGLQVATASFNKDIADFDINNDDHIKKIASMAMSESFKLPNLDCGACGYETCYNLAKKIVSKNESIEKCISLNPPISVKVDGIAFPLNSFTSEMIKNTILAMISTLKGSKKGKVQIEL